MKYVMDGKSGMMVQKRDESIYFGASQGGGLIVDDRKNNVKYIIERDETVTWLFSRRTNLHLYDIRDSRIIADRVLRKFGRDNKYSDYKYFMRNMKTDDENANKGEKLHLECTCADISKKKWDEYMKDAKKIDYESLVSKIKKELPDLYRELRLDLFNPYHKDTYETDKHYILTHSATEYFIKKGDE